MLKFKTPLAAAIILAISFATLASFAAAFAQGTAPAEVLRPAATPVPADSSEAALIVRADSESVWLLKKFGEAKAAGKLLDAGALMPCVWLDLIEEVRDRHRELVDRYYDALAEGRGTGESGLLKVRSAAADIVKKFESYGYWTCLDLDDPQLQAWTTLDDIRSKAMVASELARAGHDASVSPDERAAAVRTLCGSATSELALTVSDFPLIEKHPAFARANEQIARFVSDCSAEIALLERRESAALERWRALQAAYDARKGFFETMSAYDDVHELDRATVAAEIEKFEKNDMAELASTLEKFSQDFGADQDAIGKKFKPLFEGRGAPGLLDPGFLYASLRAGLADVPKMKKALNGEAQPAEKATAELVPTTREIYLKTFGDAKDPAIVFLHGGPGYNCFAFEASAAAKLAESGYFVIAYDQRGQGRSKIAPSKFTFDEYVADLKMICDKFNLTRVSLIGHSFGGLIAIRFARAYPAAVDRIIFADAPVDYPAMFKTILARCREFYAKNHPESVKFIDEIEKTDPASLGYENYCFYHAMNCGLYRAKKFTDEAKAIYEEMSKSPEARLLTESYNVPVEGFWKNEKYSSADYSAEVALLPKTIRLFGIYGKDDGLFDASSLDGIKKLVGEANFEVVEDASHNVFADQRSKFIEFVNRHR